MATAFAPPRRVRARSRTIDRGPQVLYRTVAPSNHPRLTPLFPARERAGLRVLIDPAARLAARAA